MQYNIKKITIVLEVVFVLLCMQFMLIRSAKAATPFNPDALINVGAEFGFPGSGLIRKQAAAKKNFPFMKLLVLSVPSTYSYYQSQQLLSDLNAYVDGNRTTTVMETSIKADDRTDPRKDDGNDLTETYYNKKGWESQAWQRITLNLFMISVAEVTRNPKKDNNEVYHFAVAPLNVGHWGTNWRFWLPIGFAVVGGFLQGDDADIYTGGGLKKGELYATELPNNYMTGIAEEVFFRGTVQKGIYKSLDSWDSFGPKTNYFTSLIGGATVFGLAHNGTQGSASSIQAFLMGLYFGYVAYPSPNHPLQEDLITSIATHAWYDMIITIGQFSHAKVHTNDKSIACYRVGDKHQVRCRERGDVEERVVYPLGKLDFKF